MLDTRRAFLQNLAGVSSAFLLFQVQPLISKFILPWFGGSPAVWTAAMLFFQVVLFGGYLYAHRPDRGTDGWRTARANPLKSRTLNSLGALHEARNCTRRKKNSAQRWTNSLSGCVTSNSSLTASRLPKFFLWPFSNKHRRSRSWPSG